MKIIKAVGKFLFFSLISYGPLFFLLFWSLLSMPFYILGMSNDLVNNKELIELIAYLIMVYLIPIISMIVAYNLYNQTSNYSSKFFILYFSWLAALFPIIFMFATMTAGISMAVVEGAVKGWDLKIQEISFAINLTLKAHLFFIPYIAIILTSSYFSEKRKLSKQK